MLDLASAAAQAVVVLLDTLGGYRLLRTIGIGSRAEVFLAHPLRAGVDAKPVVIKVYGSAVSDESIVTEIEALSRAAGDHVVELVDVTSTPDGTPALVLARHAAGSLARLQADRAGLEPGEAITLLAPLATTLARLHAAGVAHGAVGPGSVLFDASGAPTLACFGRATLHGKGLPVALLETEQAVLADVLAFGALAAAVLENIGASALAHRARTEAAPGEWLTTFADSLFPLAEPLPLDLRRRGEGAAVSLPVRVVPAQAVAPVDEPVPPSRLRELSDAVRQALGRVRKPVWVVAGASLVALVVALVAVPQGRAPAAETLPSAVPSAVAPVDSEPVGGDDPVAAALVLMAAREACIRDLAVECLDDITQADSSARAADRELVASILAGEGAGVVPKIDAATVTLTQRLGDSALVALGPESEPASVLLVKGEAGWRIRDYLEE